MRNLSGTLLFLSILLAIVLRIAVFTQNRNLFIDEANVARNIYEKNYIELTQALDYEQFAPPLFLWALKTNALIFGYGEKSLRLFPFLASILSIVGLVYLGHTTVGKQYVIYPLLLFGGGYIFMRYGTELKQYSSDFMVSLFILIFAIKTKKKWFKFKYAISWSLIGIIAIWLSMPSVFILFGIGVYWFVYGLFNDKKYVRTAVLVSGVWLSQFLIYFILILQDQIGSDYLQNFHADYFLSLPRNLHSLRQNTHIVLGIVREIGGHTFIALSINISFILLGTYTTIRKQPLFSLVYILPIVALLLAALLNKYALVPRLILFIMPLLLALMLFGVASFFSLVKNNIARCVCILLMIIVVSNHQNFKYIIKPFVFQEIEDAFSALQETNMPSLPVLVHHGAMPSFRYYTEIHPHKNKLQNIKQRSVLMLWDSDYASQIRETNQRSVYVLLTNYYPYEKDKLYAALHPDFKIKELITDTGCWLMKCKEK